MPIATENYIATYDLEDYLPEDYSFDMITEIIRVICSRYSSGDTIRINFNRDAQKVWIAHRLALQTITFSQYEKHFLIYF